MEYRKATIDDVEALIQLRKQQLADEGIPAVCDIDREMQQYFFSKISEHTFISWLAVINDEIIATSGVCFYQLPPFYSNPTGMVAYVTNMYTKNEYRRKGIAATLLGKILKEIEELGIHIIRLHASKDGRPLYEKFGFTDTDGYMVLRI